VWAGTLNFDGKLLQSSLWLNRFAELNSDGGEFRSIKMDYDARLRPGRAFNIGTITTDTLSLGFGSRVIFDLGEGLQADQVNTKYMSIETKNWQYGPKYLQPVFEFVVPEGKEIALGNYLIGSVEKLQGSLGSIRIEGLDSKLKAQLKLEDDGKLYLKLSDTREAASIVWTGAATTSAWDMANTENFVNAEGQSDIFVSGDNVRFNDQAITANVMLSGDLEADTVWVDNQLKNYTFNGNGSLTGNTTLVKSGKAILTVKTDNSYTGGNRLSGGIVIVTSLANANQAKGNLGAMTTSASKFVMENGAELRTSGAVTNGSAIRFETEEGGVINNSGDFIVDRAMTGTLLTKKGTGWMKLNVSNTALSKLVVAAGTVQCVNANTPAKVVEYQGGTLRENTGSSYTVNVPQGKTGT
jgi:lipopolysaccharide export system protein LptA